MNSTSNYSSGQPQDDASLEQQQPTSQPLAQPQTTASAPRAFAEADVHIGLAEDISLPAGVPPVSDACILHGDEPAQGFTRVIMTPSAIAQVKSHAESNMSVELGGLLLGRVYAHNHHTFVEVEQAIPAESADKGSVHFTFTADTWSQLNKASAAFPELTVVGWFHTHPNLGVFFSSDDEVVHATFPHRWMVGLVVDPLREQVNYFGWLNDQILPIGGFYEKLEESIDDQPTQATMPWRVMIDHSWFNTSSMFALRSGGLRDRNRVRDREMAAFDAGLPPISPWVGALLGATSLTVSLVTLGLVIYKFWLQ